MHVHLLYGLRNLDGDEVKKRQCYLGAQVCLIIGSPTMIVTHVPETRKSAEWFDSDYNLHKEYFPYKSLRLAKDWKKKNAES